MPGPLGPAPGLEGGRLSVAGGERLPPEALLADRAADALQEGGFAEGLREDGSSPDPCWII